MLKWGTLAVCEDGLDALSGVEARHALAEVVEQPRAVREHGRGGVVAEAGLSGTLAGERPEGVCCGEVSRLRVVGL